MQVALWVGRLVDLYSLVIVARVILSWVGQEDSHAVARFLVRVTEPVLAPLRALLPAMGGLDLSPVLALLALQFVRRLLVRLWM